MTRGQRLRAWFHRVMLSRREPPRTFVARIAGTRRGRIALGLGALTVLRVVDWIERHETNPIDPPGHRHGSVWDTKRGPV